jgi:hypothetical protein
MRAPMVVRMCTMTRLTKYVVAVLASVALTTAQPTVSTAQSPELDAQGAAADLAHASDFRVRVSAALLVGKTRPEGARRMLERALEDPHAAVRTAAAAALALVGERAAIASLESHARNEVSGSARAQMQATIASLSHGDRAPTVAPAHARYVVEIGQMRNMTSVRGGELSSVLRDAARAQALSLPGAAVYDAGDPQADRAASRMPVLLLEGQITKLQQAQSNGAMHIDARVEFSVRRVPQQTLKGTLSGGASSIESMRTVSGQRLVELENQTIGSAVESAMRGADSGLALAAK